MANNQLNKVTSNVSNDDNNNHHHQQQKNQQHEHNGSVSTNHIRIFKPRYLRMLDKMFKQMLSNEIEQGDTTIQYLDTKEKIQFVRQMAEAMNNLYYFDLQRQLWQAYYDIGMKEGVWTSRVSKSFAKQHHTCRSYGFLKHIIEKCHHETNQQCQQVIDSVQQYIIELEEKTQQW